MSLSLTEYSNCNAGFVMHCFTVFKSFHFNALLSCCRTLITDHIKHLNGLEYYFIFYNYINTFFVLF